MKCPECGFELSDSAKFCEDCGAEIPQEKECPNCHTKAAPAAKFCSECGYRFGGDAPTLTRTGYNAVYSMGSRNVLAEDVIGGISTVNASLKTKQTERGFIDKNMMTTAGRGLSYNSNAANASESADSSSDISMGDKNVIAGDVIGKHETNTVTTHYSGPVNNTTIINNGPAQEQSPKKKDVHDVLKGMEVISGDSWKDAEVTSVEHLTIPANVKAIQPRTFRGWSNLQTVCFAPGSLMELGRSSFEECTSLEEVILPDGMNRIGDNAFLKCSSLTRVDFNRDLGEIGNSAFEKCDKLEKIELPASVRVIEREAFQECGHLEEFIFDDIRHSVLETIGDRAFIKCVKLERFRLPDSVASIGDEAFLDSNSLESVSFGNKLETIGKSAFEGCSGLEEITIPPSVKVIDNNAFKSCTSLEKIRFTEYGALKSIGESAFDGCYKLKSVVIPDGVEVAENAFCSHVHIEFASEKKTVATGPSPAASVRPPEPSAAPVRSPEYRASEKPSVSAQKNVQPELPDRPDTDPKPALKAKHLLSVSPFLKECSVLLSGNRIGYRRFIDPENEFRKYYASEQFGVEYEAASGKWFLVPYPGTANRSVLNGEVVTSRTELHDGDWVAVAERGSSEYHGLIRLFMKAKS